MAFKMVDQLFLTWMHLRLNIFTEHIKFDSITPWLPPEMKMRITTGSFQPKIGSFKHCILNQPCIVAMGDVES